MNEVAKLGQSAIEAVILQGDLSKLTPDQRGQYVATLCETMGLNPLTKPFEFITLNGKLTCYAGKNCAEQLRRVHNVSIRVTSRETLQDVYVVTVEASLPNGRVDASTGAVALAGLKGEALANAFLKAETKAKRRVTLSVCGLGMLDETEVESIPNNSAPPKVTPGSWSPGDGVFDSSYVIPFGKYGGRKIHDIAPEDLTNYCDYLEMSAAKAGKPMRFEAVEFIAKARDFVALADPSVPGAPEAPLAP